jgi:hypothetical protein
LRYTRARLASTVLRLTKSFAAISRLVRPAVGSLGDRLLGGGRLVGGAADADPGQLGARLLGPQRRADVLEGGQRSCLQ